MPRQSGSLNMPGRSGSLLDAGFITLKSITPAPLPLFHPPPDMPTKTMAQVQAAAEALVHSGVNKVLVKLGSKGSMLVGEGRDGARPGGSRGGSWPGNSSRCEGQAGHGPAELSHAPPVPAQHAAGTP